VAVFAYGRRLSLVIWLVILVGGAALIVAGGFTDLPIQLRYSLLATVFGATVAASEIVSRYRDEPMQALTSTPASIYLLVNAAVSGLVYGLLTKYSGTIIPSLAGDPLMRSVVAGFGAMAILRTKFFTYRTEGGEEVGIGPDAAVSAFLNAADRGIDRLRASRRLWLVTQEAENTFRPEVGGDFLQISLAAFQNLSTEEKAEFAQIIEDMKSAPYPPSLKLRAISYGLLGIAGERSFKEVMRGLRVYAPSEEPGGSTLPGGGDDVVEVPPAQPPPDEGDPAP
jgi:hypothetical protein